LKHTKLEEISKDISVFIHRSIKTRIETREIQLNLSTPYHVFIHRSIKTRIETP